jgi:hypothetical protein
MARYYSIWHIIPYCSGCIILSWILHNLIFGPKMWVVSRLADQLLTLGAQDGITDLNLPHCRGSQLRYLFTTLLWRPKPTFNLMRLFIVVF